MSFLQICKPLATCSRVVISSGFLTRLNFGTLIKNEFEADQNQRSEYWRKKIDGIENQVKSGDTSHNAWKAYEEMGIEYEHVVVAKWGYVSHQLAVNLLLKHRTFEEMIKLSSNDNKKINILDAGCGTGLVGKYLKQMSKCYCDKLTITGIDLSPNMVSTAASSCYNGESIYDKCYVQDLDSTPYTNLYNKRNQFDAIISAGVLPYCKNHDSIIFEWSQLLKQNGILVASLRNDMTDIAIDKFSNVEKTGILQRLELTKPIKHIKNSETYGDSLKAQFYVAKKIV